MAAKRMSSSKSINPSGFPGPRDDLKPALAPIATALTEELAALLAAVLDGRKRKTLDRLSQALSDAVPELLQRAFEHELLADGVVASEHRAKLVAALSAGNTPQRRTSSRQMPINSTDGSSDWLSAESVAKLLNVSSAHVKKLAKAGELGEVDTDSNGVTRLERTAVLTRYEEMKRRQQTGLQTMVDSSERAGVHALEIEAPAHRRKAFDRACAVKRNLSLAITSLPFQATAATSVGAA
jgi:hypothetical protein